MMWMMELCLCPQSGPGNVSCSESLLRGDRLMVVNQLNTSLEELWTNSACDSKSSNWKWFSERHTYVFLRFCLCLFVWPSDSHTFDHRGQSAGSRSFERAVGTPDGAEVTHTHTHVTLIGLTLSTNHSSLWLSKIFEIVCQWFIFIADCSRKYRFHLEVRCLVYKMSDKSENNVELYMPNAQRCFPKALLFVPIANIFSSL